MKKLNNTEVKNIIGGDSCWDKWEWNTGVQRCELITYCSDKHGTHRKGVKPGSKAGGTMTCPGRTIYN
jgi:hypothetical protein